MQLEGERGCSSVWVGGRRVGAGGGWYISLIHGLLVPGHNGGTRLFP